MAATSAQIEAVLSLTGEYSLITGAATITDNSAWGSISVATPDTVKILLWIVDSAGNDFYKNAGWDAGSYASPDLSLLDTEYDFTLPTDIAGDYLQGKYTIYAKVQVVEGSDTTVVQKTFYQNVSAQCNDIALTTEAGVIAGTTEVKITDTTNYATYTNLSRTMILYPPPPSGQASQTGTDVDVIVYSGTVYTGVWTWKLTSDVTFTDAITGTSTTCRLTAQGTFNVEQSQLCKVLCLIEKYRNQTLLPTLTKKNGAALLQTYFLAMTEFQLARDGYICGKSSTVIDAHIQKVYDLLGIDPDCDCGCDDGTSQPLLSVTTVDGTDGTNGSVIYSGSGAPSGGTGVVGDYFVRSDTGGWYKKTGATTWTLQFTIVGATGAAGADGSNGVAVLHNDITDSTTATDTQETLKTFSLTAGQLSADGDIIHVRARFRKTADSTLSLCWIYLGAAVVLNDYMIDAGEDKLVMDAYITRTGAATGKSDNTIWKPSTTTQVNPLVALTPTWANAQNITIQANDAGGQSITCELFQVTYYKWGSGASFTTSIFYATPFTTTAAVQTYPNVIGTTGKTVKRVYLDGVLLTSADWSYDNTTDILTFVLAITGASEVQIDYQ